MGNEVITTEDVNNADDMHAFLEKALVEQAFGKVGPMYIEHPTLGRVVKIILVERTLTDNSKVHDISLLFEGD